MKVLLLMMVVMMEKGCVCETAPRPRRLVERDAQHLRLRLGFKKKTAAATAARGVKARQHVVAAGGHQLHRTAEDLERR
ncbi:hypothetical protein DQ04_13701000 [Trypanosoma grayi]|uniref:hypothetical protein n=1 Tax=Trypanosoma grayi TaxID=71804 RepID=UPI0004F489FC|nr:hypothetical protein DQ04_13701000 [Trypanosoma grayi]KEG06484.1 hypothetical protein DQ04_13701000 [Trypanosoma grayi]